MIEADDRGHRALLPQSLRINTRGAAGQSYGAFCNAGMVMHHQGTANDGVGKSQSGGIVAIVSPGGGELENALIGNFALVWRNRWRAVRRGRGRRSLSAFEIPAQRL